MRILVMSDIHIGDSRLKNEDDIVQLLEREKYERLILNGDIIDTWILGHRKAVMQSKIVDAITNVARAGVPVIWIAGNHDPIDSNQVYIPGAKVFNTYRFNKRFLALHGHQVYPFYDQATFSKVLANINSWLYRVFKIDWQNVIRENPVYKERTRRKREELLDKFGNPGDTVFMGHTHLAGTQHKGNKTVYDSGSIMLDGTYLIIEDGEVYHKTIGE